MSCFFCSVLLSASLIFNSNLSFFPVFYNHSFLQENIKKTDSIPGDTNEEDIFGLSAPSVLLMEASTGTILYEKDSHALLRPASITKIMTLILIFDAISSGGIALDDTVTVSEYAASMGGSQVFLEQGETQTVDTLIKCISVASANDACVAMAEYISGTEAAFVENMNRRAKELGMNDTTFVNCCGLDADGHLTSAYDVALMSRELTMKYPQIHEYSTIWTDTITHITKRGTQDFGLTNTNRLIRQYPYATGLKTGSTSLAKYCVSATAKKDDMELIAVVMAAPDPKARFTDASSLLNYGFSKYQIFVDENTDILSSIPVKKGTSNEVPLSYRSSFQYVVTSETELSGITKEIELPDFVNAPVLSGDVLGRAVYKLGNKTLGTVDILCAQNIAAAAYHDCLMELLSCYLP